MYDGFVTIAWRKPVFARCADKALLLLAHANKKGVRLLHGGRPDGCCKVWVALAALHVGHQLAQGVGLSCQIRHGAGSGVHGVGCLLGAFVDLKD